MLDSTSGAQCEEKVPRIRIIMSFTLDKVVPWGRSFDEYRDMFSLSADDLDRRILGCGDGPASFNTELTRRGGKIVSADPLYQFSRDEIAQRIDATYDEILQLARLNQNQFIWDSIKSIDDLGRIRRQAMDAFLDDYQQGSERYVNAALPDLPFEDGAFELGLCSHYLFLYSEQHSLEFHVQSLKELARVCREARVFPLLELGSRKSRHLESALEFLENEGYKCGVETVSYEFQRGGNQTLRIKESPTHWRSSTSRLR